MISGGFMTENSKLWVLDEIQKQSSLLLAGMTPSGGRFFQDVPFRKHLCYILLLLAQMFMAKRCNLYSAFQLKV